MQGKTRKPAKRATAQNILGLSPASRALTYIYGLDPRACALGFMLSPASRAKISVAPISYAVARFAGLNQCRADEYPVARFAGLNRTSATRARFCYSKSNSQMSLSDE